MKKLLFLFMLLFATNMASAQAQPTILHPTTNGNTEKEGSNKSPLTPVYAYQNDHTFIFDVSCIGCPVTLLDGNGEMVYIDVVDENGVVELPETLVGTFELQLVKDGITFVGEIEL